MAVEPGVGAWINGGNMEDSERHWKGIGGIKRSELGGTKDFKDGVMELQVNCGEENLEC